MVNVSELLINVVKANRSKLLTDLNQNGMQSDNPFHSRVTRTNGCRRRGRT
jgi:hypothetical protein